MARIFKNPQNGHQEKVFGDSWVGVLFFGACYLIAKGQWGHFVIWVLVVAGFALLAGMPGLIIALVALNVVYAFMIQRILVNSYLRKGWVESYANSTLSVTGQGERVCPFCAEVIKSAAIRCKHCGAEFEPATELTESGEQSFWSVKIPFRDENEVDEAWAILSENAYPLLDSSANEIIVGPYDERASAASAKKKIGFKYAMHGEVHWVRK